MLNILWPIFIIISFIFSVGTGKINQLNTAIFDSAKDAVQMTITFFGTICMWNGVMKILQETSIMSKMTKLVSPIMKFLFFSCIDFIAFNPKGVAAFPNPNILAIIFIVISLYSLSSFFIVGNKIRRKN